MKHNFEVVDPMDKVATVAARWRDQYRHYKPDHILVDGSTVGGIQKALDKLPANATPKQVAKIIGNEGWTSEMCRSCYAYFDKGVVFDTNGDHPTAVCLPCLKTAVRKASK